MVQLTHPMTNTSFVSYFKEVKISGSLISQEQFQVFSTRLSEIQIH